MFYHPPLTIRLINYITLVFLMMPHVALSQTLSESEIRQLVARIDWSQVTFGFEAEARDKDTGRNDVAEMSAEIAQRNGPKLGSEASSYIASQSEEASGNKEFKSIVLTRPNIFQAMRDINRRLNKGNRPGVRGFHLHVRFPDEMFGNMTLSERLAFLSRFGDASMAVRLENYKPFYALKTWSVKRADPLLWDGGRAVVRYQQLSDNKVDVEFRGFIRSLMEMEQIVDRFFVALQNPSLRQNVSAIQTALALPPLPLVGALNQWAADQGKAAITISPPHARMKLITESYLVIGVESWQQLLPLIPFELQPWVSHEMREKFIQQRKRFLEQTYDLVMNSTAPPKDRFRKLVQNWAKEINFADFTKQHLLVKTPETGIWPKEAISPALVRYLVSDYSYITSDYAHITAGLPGDQFILNQLKLKITTRQPDIDAAKKQITQMFDPKDLGEAARGQLTQAQAQVLANLLDTENRSKFVEALAASYNTSCNGLTPYLY